MPRGRGKREEDIIPNEKRSRRATLATIWPTDDLCPLCGRELVPGASVNDHHLVPKSRGGKEKYALHRVCHSKIHSVFSETELAVVFNSFEKLKEHEQIRRFIKWVRKQPPERVVKNRRLKH